MPFVRWLRRRFVRVIFSLLRLEFNIDRAPFGEQLIRALMTSKAMLQGNLRYQNKITTSKIL
jgi:hypothetical protein